MIKYQHKRQDHHGRFASLQTLQKVFSNLCVEVNFLVLQFLNNQNPKTTFPQPPLPQYFFGTLINPNPFHSVLDFVDCVGK